MRTKHLSHTSIRSPSTQHYRSRHKITYPRKWLQDDESIERLKAVIRSHTRAEQQQQNGYASVASVHSENNKDNSTSTVAEGQATASGTPSHMSVGGGAQCGLSPNNMAMAAGVTSPHISSAPATPGAVNVSQAPADVHATTVAAQTMGADWAEAAGLLTAHSQQQQAQQTPTHFMYGRVGEPMVSSLAPQSAPVTPTTHTAGVGGVSASCFQGRTPSAASTRSTPATPASSLFQHHDSGGGSSGSSGNTGQSTPLAAVSSPLNGSCTTTPQNGAATPLSLTGPTLHTQQQHHH